MSGNTSATGGPLAPTGAPLSDDALDDALQALVAAVTGLDGTLVRPRFQIVPPRQPEPEIDWCAIGVMTEEGDANPAIAHDPTGGPGGQGQDTFARHEQLEVLASFYGPNGAGLAKRLRDGLMIPQNMENVLLKFVNSGTIRKAPEQVNQRWVTRHDMVLKFRQKTERTYQVENFVETPFSVTPS